MIYRRYLLDLLALLLPLPPSHTCHTYIPSYATHELLYTTCCMFLSEIYV